MSKEPHSNPIVIAGGSGFLGISLATHLAGAGHRVIVLSRKKPSISGPWQHVAWDARTTGDWCQVLDGAAGLVNLAGRSVDCIKTPDHCDEILRSRVEATLALGRALRLIQRPPPVWVQMSTAHIYGDPPSVTCDEDSPYGYGLAPLVDHFLAISREKDRALSRHLCPVDQRLQNFLYDQLEAGPDLAGEVPRLPASTLVLDRAGLARVLSLPPGADEHRSGILSSYRVKQGVLHNPRSDRRTTQGIFHIADLGLPVPDDKKAVPPHVFGRLLRHALNAPPDLLRLPAVRALLAFLRVVADPSNSLELYALATSAPYLLPAQMLNPALQQGRRRSLFVTPARTVVVKALSTVEERPPN